MSITRLALRICAVEALKGNTGVKDNVFNSRNGILDVLSDGSIRTDMDKPFIAVYTETSIDKAPDRQSLRSNKNLDIVFEFAATRSMAETDEQGQSFIVPYVLATDEGMELFLDMVEADIITSLHDEKNVWSELFRMLIGTVVEVERRRVGNETTGVALAAQQLRVRVNALPDPVFGQTLKDGSAWQKFLDVLKTQQHRYFNVISPVFEEKEGADNGARRFGLTLQEAEALMVD